MRDPRPRVRAGFADTTRPYSAIDVVSLRGTPMKETYAGDAMSKKLWATLQMCKATGNHSRTFGALDPIQAAMFIANMYGRGRSQFLSS